MAGLKKMTNQSCALCVVKTVTTLILPTANMRRTYEGIGIYVDDWKINPIGLLGGHGNRKIVLLAVLKGMV
jgi:hypothetical protein